MDGWVGGRAVLQQSFKHMKIVCHWVGGWMDWWMGGWIGGRARLKIAYSNQKFKLTLILQTQQSWCRVVQPDVVPICWRIAPELGDVAPRIRLFHHSGCRLRMPFSPWLYRPWNKWTKLVNKDTKKIVLFSSHNHKFFLKDGTPVGCILSIFVVLLHTFPFLISGMKAVSTNRAATFQC